MVDSTQTILTAGMPTLAVLVGILINNSRLSDLRGYIDQRFADAAKVTETRFQQVLSKIEDMEKVNEARFGMLLGKIEDIDNRLTRLEARFAR